MKDWIEGVVTESIHWTDKLFSLKVDADIEAFTAGQFTSLALDIDGERVARPYSYLNAPHQRPAEFFFYAADGGKLSNALHKLHPGDRLWLKHAANGYFTIDEVPDSRDIWMIGTGTGIAPFYSMLNTDTPWKRFDNIILVHGVRAEADLRYLEIGHRLAAQYPTRFHFQGFVSRETVPGTLAGRIPAAIANGSLEEAVGIKIDKENSQLMLCGNPEMVNDTIEILKARGMQRNRRRAPGHITVENYW